MLDVNEQTELDILLTVEEPNEYMKGRIKELQEKAKLPEDKDKKECGCMGCAVKGAKTIEEHHQAILDYCFKKEGETNVRSFLYKVYPEHKEQIDRLWKELELDDIKPIAGKWANRIINKHLDKYTPENEEFVYFKELSESSEANDVTLFFYKAIINFQKECMIVSSVATNITSLIALVDVNIVKTCIMFIIDLALKYKKDFDNPCVINIALANIHQYVNENLREVLHALSENLDNTEVGTL